MEVCKSLVSWSSLLSCLPPFAALHCSHEGQQSFSGAQQPFVTAVHQHKAQLCPCHTEATAPCRHVLFHWCSLMPALRHSKELWPCQQVRLAWYPGVICLPFLWQLKRVLRAQSHQDPGGSRSHSKAVKPLTTTPLNSPVNSFHPPEGLRGSTRGWEWVVLSCQADWWGERGRAAAAVTALLPAPLLLVPFLPPGFFPDSQHHHPKVSLEEGICLLVCLFIICLIRGRTEKKAHKQSACLFLFPALFPLPPFSSCC